MSIYLASILRTGLFPPNWVHRLDAVSVLSARHESTHGDTIGVGWHFSPYGWRPIGSEWVLDAERGCIPATCGPRAPRAGIIACQTRRSIACWRVSSRRENAARPTDDPDEALGGLQRAQPAPRVHRRGPCRWAPCAGAAACRRSVVDGGHHCRCGAGPQAAPRRRRHRDRQIDRSHDRQGGQCEEGLTKI